MLRGKATFLGVVVHGVVCHQDQPPCPTVLEENPIAVQKNLMCRTSAAIVIKERGEDHNKNDIRYTVVFVDAVSVISMLLKFVQL